MSVTEMTHARKFCLLGFPDHLGVMNVKGRIGAALGPDSFRQVFFKLLGGSPLEKPVVDLGNLSPVTGDITANHMRAIELVESAQRKHSRTVMVGGGHDYGYPHLAGIKKVKRGEIGCINIDAHFDLRKPQPIVTSGSPFYLALENEVLNPQHFVEFGIQRHCNSPDLFKYVKDKKIKTVLFEELRLCKKGSIAAERFEKELKRLARRCDSLVISLDLDAVSEASAPGVSAPQSEGFSPSEIMQMMEIAAEEKKVCSLGIFELNPLHDRDQITARLAATAAYYFLRNSK